MVSCCSMICCFVPRFLRTGSGALSFFGVESRRHRLRLAARDRDPREDFGGVGTSSGCGGRGLWTLGWLSASVRARLLRAERGVCVRDGVGV